MAFYAANGAVFRLCLLHLSIRNIYTLHKNDLICFHVPPCSSFIFFFCCLRVYFVHRSLFRVSPAKCLVWVRCVLCFFVPSTFVCLIVFSSVSLLRTFSGLTHAVRLVPSTFGMRCMFSVPFGYITSADSWHVTGKGGRNTTYTGCARRAMGWAERLGKPLTAANTVFGDRMVRILSVFRPQECSVLP